MKTILTFIVLLIIELPLFSQQITDWTSLNLTEPGNLNSRSISVVDSNIIWCAGTVDNIWITANMVSLTIDGGQNFEVFTLPSSNSEAIMYDICAIDENTAYTVTLGSNGGNQIAGIHRTTDGGQNWDLVFKNEDNNFSAIQVHFYNALDGFIYGFTGAFNAAFFHTNDGGDTWEKSVSEFTLNGIWTEGGNDGGTVMGDTAWFSSTNQLFRSVDKGITWSSHQVGVNSNRIYNDIAFKNNNHGLAISSKGTGGNDLTNVLFKTEDGGLTWTFIPLVLPNSVEANNISYIPGTEGAYLITSGNSPFDENFLFTLDNGNTWQEGVAPSSLQNAVFLSPTLGFGGTNTNNGGLLKYNDNIFSVSTAINELVIDNSVLQIYPNPVTDQLQISLENEWQGELNIQVVNGLGQTVRSISLEKNGTHFSRQINVAGLTVGIYRLLVSDGEEMMIQSFVKQ